MRVTLCIQRIAGLTGSTEKTLIDLSNQLSIRGHDVDILSYEDIGEPPSYPLRAGIIVRNIKPFDDRRRSRAWRNSLREPSVEWAIEGLWTLLDKAPIVCRVRWRHKYRPMIKRLSQFIDWHRPDLVISFTPSMFPYVILARRAARHRPPIIVASHNSPVIDFGSLDHRDRNRYDRWWRRRCLRDAEAVIVTRPEYLDWFTTSERRNIYVIPRTIAPAQEAEGARENIFFSVGDLWGRENLEVLLRAYGLVYARTRTWMVRISGCNALDVELSSAIKEHGLQDVVLLMPSSAIISDELAKSKVTVLPSMPKDLPFIVYESFAAGVPIVGFADCSGLDRLVKNEENGLLVDGDGDRVAKLASAMEALAINEALRQSMSETARRHVGAEECSPERVFGAWNRLVEDVSGSSSLSCKGKTG